MPKFFIKNEQVSDDSIIILGDDVNHIKNVLRMKLGDTLSVCDYENSVNYEVKIEEFLKNEILCKIQKMSENMAESNVKVHIYQGLPKADKMEMIIQKSVELGVEAITPVEMKRCVVKLDGKDKVKKRERWQKISEVAAKQSGRDIIPKIYNIMSIEEVTEEFSNYDIVLLCYENEKNNLLKNILNEVEESGNLKVAVIIGPEGGIDISEVEYMEKKGAKVVSLGNRILRTETVCLAMLSIIMYEFERNED